MHLDEVGAVLDGLLLEHGILAEGLKALVLKFDGLLLEFVVIGTKG